MDIGPSATKTRMDKESLTYELDISLSAQGHKLCGAIDKGKKKAKKSFCPSFCFPWLLSPPHRNTYWEASRAVPGPWQQQPAGCQGAEVPASVRLADFPRSLVYVDETSASLPAPFVSYRFSPLISDSIHPTKEG